MGLGWGQRDLDGARLGAGQVWQASGVRSSPGSCLLPVFLAFAASVRFGLFPFASGFFSPRELTVLNVCCSGGQREKEKQRDGLLFWEMSSQGLIMKNFVPKERDPEIPEQRKKKKKKLAAFVLSISERRGGGNL